MTPIPGTRLAFASLADWCWLYRWRCQVGRASAGEYRRRSAILHALTADQVAASRDLAGLSELDALLRTTSGPVRFDHGAGDARQRNALLIATHNRRHQLETGAAFRDRVRHGPADPARMPDRALERVIQGCRDLALVERCRRERARRNGIG